MPKNIVQHNFDINESEYVQKNDHKSGVIWLTGLSGSGKSSIANHTLKELFDDYQIMILDGDDVRSGLNEDLSFTQEDRQENLRRVAHVARLFRQKGFIVLCSFISPMNSQRKMIRDIVNEDFHLTFINTSLSECENRDPKGLYAKARSGEIKNFTGIDAPFEEPNHSELIINTHNKDIEECSNELKNYIEKNFKVNK